MYKQKYCSSQFDPHEHVVLIIWSQQLRYYSLQVEKQFD